MRSGTIQPLDYASTPRSSQITIAKAPPETTSFLNQQPSVLRAGACPEAGLGQPLSERMQEASRLHVIVCGSAASSQAYHNRWHSAHLKQSAQQRGQATVSTYLRLFGRIWSSFPMRSNFLKADNSGCAECCLTQQRRKEICTEFLWVNLQDPPTYSLTTA